MDIEGRNGHAQLHARASPRPSEDVAGCVPRQRPDGPPSASLLRKAAFDDVGGFDERLSGYEDDDLFVRMFRADWKHVFVPKPLTRFRIHTNGGTPRSPLGFLDSRMTFLEKLVGSIEDDDRMNRTGSATRIAPFFLTTVDDYARALSRLPVGPKRVAPPRRRGSSRSMMEPRVRRRIEVALMSRPKLCRRACRDWTGCPPSSSVRQPDSAPPHPQPRYST